MSMLSVPNIDHDLKQDFFNCYKFENDAYIQPDNPYYPKSIIGVRNYNKNIEQFWNNYKPYIINKYQDYQITQFCQNVAEIEDLNEKFSVMFKLVNPDNSHIVYILSYYNANNVNIEFYEQIDPIYIKENWKLEKFIELYKEYNKDDMDARLNIKQIITIADDYIQRFYHVSTNNTRHYSEEFLKIYQNYKQMLLNKQNLY